MRTTLLLAIALLTGTLASASQRMAPPSRTLELSIAVDPDGACRSDADGHAIGLPVRLTIRNHSASPLRVLPDTVQLTNVQIVRTVEELVPMGGNTPGIVVGGGRRPDKGAARLLAPGGSVEVVRELTIEVARPHAPGGGFEPGHYFLELIGIIETAASGSGSVRAESVVSPYVGIDIPAAVTAVCAPASR